MDKINTISKNSQFQFKEKGSLFIGYLFPIQNHEEAESILADVRKKHYDATHNCYAYKFIDDESFKYSDDGEPNGTAGIRIFNAIKHFNLSNVLIISTRYFGGTKLGVGPLGKAYYNSAIGAIENADIVVKENYSKILIDFGYDYISDVHHFINTYKAQNINNLFDKNPLIECLIKPEFIQKLGENLISVSNGKIEIKILEENIYL
ncbi:MAG: YigZ family protein [Bacteroidetes bacterium]|nr:YigZ family protein [Bacteroidota bacterium]MBU1115467.1 YigZ family protein [Bacteroidota bacterium]MBU1800088.1 YigZ family protein [Bacteroidota bacterium]